MKNKNNAWEWISAWSMDSVLLQSADFCNLKKTKKQSKYPSVITEIKALYKFLIYLHAKVFNYRFSYEFDKLRHICCSGERWRTNLLEETLDDSSKYTFMMKKKFQWISNDIILFCTERYVSDETVPFLIKDVLRRKINGTTLKWGCHCYNSFPSFFLTDEHTTGFDQNFLINGWKFVVIFGKQKLWHKICLLEILIFKMMNVFMFPQLNEENWKNITTSKMICESNKN